MNSNNFTEANMDYLQDLSGGNSDLIREIVALFIKQTPGDMELLGTYIREQNWTQAYKQAHHIKPTLAYVGANTMRAELQEIEDRAKNQRELDTIAGKFNNLLPRFEVLYQELRSYLDTMDS
jgi:FOG: HPt domain